MANDEAKTKKKRKLKIVLVFLIFSFLMSNHVYLLNSCRRRYVEHFRNGFMATGKLYLNSLGKVQEQKQIQKQKKLQILCVQHDSDSLNSHICVKCK